jgi:ribosomal protein S18 acetylase RimI-like enzyme
MSRHSPDELKFRRFRREDAPAVRELHELALRRVGAFAESPEARTWDRDLDDIEQSYLANGGEFLVGRAVGQIVAMGGLRVHDASRGQVKRMRVHPDYQGRGYGRALLERLEKHARDIGLSELFLDTSPVQVAALSLYESSGYLEMRRLTEGGVDMIFLEKSLASDVLQRT